MTKSHLLNKMMSTHSKNMSKNLVEQSVAMVNVYYESLYYTVVSECPAITFSSLLGTVGNLVNLKEMFLKFKLLFLICF